MCERRLLQVRGEGCMRSGETLDLLLRFTASPLLCRELVF